MLTTHHFMIVSFEMNLFFQRIMKEHMFLIETSLQQTEMELIEKAKVLKQGFERLLSETVDLANDAVTEGFIESNEFVTPYTLKAEETAMALTGANINTGITKRELKLRAGTNDDKNSPERTISDINAKSLKLLADVIAFKKKVLDLTLSCKISIALYPELLFHIIREAEYYKEILTYLKDKKRLTKTLCDELDFWNHIMSDHAQFIDGMLDPIEKNLKETAGNIADKFEKLTVNCIRTAEGQMIQRSQEAAEDIKNYKKAATEGLLNCKIKSIISPLLADHVLREANHYLRLLRSLRT